MQALPTPAELGGYVDFARLYQLTQIKQHLLIKAFYGTSPNAVKTQIWIAIAVYVLVSILRKNLGIDREPYTLLQILSVYGFEKVPVAQLLSAPAYTPKEADIRNQLSLPSAAHLVPLEITPARLIPPPQSVLRSCLLG